jgi:hypothetical protein
MNDTSIDTAKKLDKIYKAKAGEEKLLIALQMFDTARELVISSLPVNLPDKELRKELFLRFYGNDFSTTDKEKILNNLRSQISS